MALLVATVVWSLMIVSVLFLKQGLDARPVAISNAAQSIDSQVFLTLVVTGILFLLAQGLLGFFVWRYHARRPGRASTLRGNRKLEATAAIVCGILFMTLGVLGQKVFARLHLSDQEPTVVVEVTAEQFAWNMRYAGADGVFGRSAPQLFESLRNPVGIDPRDPAGVDDVVLLNQLVVPVSQVVELRLRAKDVLHSFYIPVLRIKQDTVPGIQTRLRFAAESPGQYEIACAELCGLGHYRMQGILSVLSVNDYESWLREQASATSR